MHIARSLWMFAFLEKFGGNGSLHCFVRPLTWLISDAINLVAQRCSWCRNERQEMGLIKVSKPILVDNS